MGSILKNVMLPLLSVIAVGALGLAGIFGFSILVSWVVQLVFMVRPILWIIAFASLGLQLVVVMPLASMLPTRRVATIVLMGQAGLYFVLAIIEGVALRFIINEETVTAGSVMFGQSLSIMGIIRYAMAGHWIDVATPIGLLALALGTAFYASWIEDK